MTILEAYQKPRLTMFRLKNKKGEYKNQAEYRFSNCGHLEVKKISGWERTKLEFGFYIISEWEEVKSALERLIDVYDTWHGLNGNPNCCDIDFFAKCILDNKYKILEILNEYEE